ncbi:MAG: glycosyltransferase [Oscillatoriales cyanobacterium RM1_1_9]|nr:glycosyltransferase [Oscillatoriales cyanobacterium SM2_3_0]NJO47208.1 glycosyltransferase [Oscillatoriales cyanobacterium RM2_1_1]NJO71141.1 glycosyltransferase [Oscillatoriales cyanobacterium RM1_1_9]
MQRLLLFTRYPEPGKTKTRLIPALGAEGATQVHRQMAAKIVATAGQLAQFHSVIVEVCYTGGNLEAMEVWLGKDLTYVQQGFGSLGDRLTLAFKNAFDQGDSGVIAVGTDCPDLTTEILLEAFRLLKQREVVIGPAEDGGYYLIGLQRFVPEVFQGIFWGTEQVFWQTAAICQQLNLNVALLPKLSDVDRPEDLAIWEKYC